MILLIQLLVVLFQAFLTASACPDTIVIKNVNWANTPDPGIFTQAVWNEETFNGKSVSLKLYKQKQFYLKENIQRLPEHLLATGEYHFIYNEAYYEALSQLIQLVVYLCSNYV